MIVNMTNKQAAEILKNAKEANRITDPDLVHALVLAINLLEDGNLPEMGSVTRDVNVAYMKGRKEGYKRGYEDGAESGMRVSVTRPGSNTTVREIRYQAKPWKYCPYCGEPLREGGRNDRNYYNRNLDKEQGLGHGIHEEIPKILVKNGIEE